MPVESGGEPLRAQAVFNRQWRGISRMLAGDFVPVVCRSLTAYWQGSCSEKRWGITGTLWTAAGT